MTDRELSTLVAGAAGYTEAQLVVLVLGLLVVAVALLSYFVVAPEYEKRLDKQYARLAQASLKRHQSQQELLFTRLKLRKYKSLGAWDIETGSSDEDYSPPRAHSHAHVRPPPASCGAISTPRDRETQTARAARRARGARRRKSESDALKQTNVARADMLRRRVLLRKLEEEIAGAIKENEQQQQEQQSADAATTRRMSNNAMTLSDDRRKMLEAHPADCVEELTLLARAQPKTPPQSPEMVDKEAEEAETAEVKRALHVLHDVLSLYLSVDHRDMNKLTVFCNSLLQHDGLNRLRAFEGSRDQDVRALSNSIIEKAVPAIWH